MAEILMAEDVEASTVGTVGTLRGWGNTVRSATSIEEALTYLPGVDCATLDQRMPNRDGDEGDASEAQIDEFARQVGACVPFVWVTAHHVPAARLEIPNCLGVIGKAGDVTAEVTRLLKERVPNFEVRGTGAHLDQVLMELRIADDGRFVCTILAWSPDEFPVRPDRLPAWLRFAVLQAPHRPVLVKARAWLGAEVPAQLDLCEYELVPRRSVDEKEIWDD